MFCRVEFRCVGFLSQTIFFTSGQTGMNDGADNNAAFYAGHTPVRLEKIHPRLHVGNAACARHVVYAPETTASPRMRVVDARAFPDDHHIEHEEFYRRVQRLALQVNAFLDNGDNVLVHCEAGLNRSVAVAVFVAILRDEGRNPTCNIAITEYVVEQVSRRRNLDPRTVLCNLRFRELLFFAAQFETFVARAQSQVLDFRKKGRLDSVVRLWKRFVREEKPLGKHANHWAARRRGGDGDDDPDAGGGRGGGRKDTAAGCGGTADGGCVSATAAADLP